MQEDSIGWIPFYNLHPMRCELMKDKGFRLQAGLPVEVNQKLYRGEVALAPCSSICLLTAPGHEIALPIGVTTRGVTDSVYWGAFDDNLEWELAFEERMDALCDIFTSVQNESVGDPRFLAPEIWERVRELPALPFPRPRLNLTPASAASAMLSKLLYEMIFGFELDGLPRGNQGRRLELLIGDEAMKKKPQYRKIYDLGDLWYRITGKPFVFAVWQSRGIVQNAWKQKLLAAAERAEARMTIEPAYYYPDMMPLDQKYEPLDLAGYWRKIRYRLGAPELQGLMLYLCLVRERFPALSTESTAVKLMKWQEMSARLCHQQMTSDAASL